MRKRAVNTVHNDIDINLCKNRQLKELFSIYFEMQLFDKALDVLKIMQERNITNNNNYPFTTQNLERLILGFYDFNSIGAKFNSKEDCDFKKEIKDKKIAIIGPSSNEIVEKEINKYDLIVMLNLSTDNINTIKADIVYYNGEKMDMILGNNGSEIPNFVKWVVVKNKLHVPLVKNSFSVRSLHMFKYLTYGTFNAVPNVLFDLLLFNPREIKVFNVTLLLPNEYGSAYNHAYSISNDKINKKIEKSFPVHDPLLQFKWMKILYKNHLITCDEKLSDILGYSDLEYMMKLRSAYIN